MKQGTVKFDKRNIVASASLNVTGIERSNQFADDYFIITREKGSSVHKGLSINDQNPMYGEGGSFIVGEEFVRTQARSLNLPTKELFMSYVAPKTTNDIPCVLHFDVEERIVGQTLELEDGTKTVFKGTKTVNKEGEKYYVPINLVFEPSATVQNKAEKFIEAKAMHVEPVEFLPRRRRGSATVATAVPEVDPQTATKDALGNE